MFFFKNPIVKHVVLLLLLGLLSTTLPPVFAEDLRIEVVSNGAGDKAQKGMQVSVHYQGRLANGTIFDDSRQRGRPISFVLGTGQVIPGWEIGVEGMRVGEKRVLTIPPDLAYGSDGAGNTIPPNAVLIFDVELTDLSWPPKLIEATSAQLIEARNNGTAIVDIRREEEWLETGVIEGAQGITAFTKDGALHPEFRQKFMMLLPNPDTPLLIYCRTGRRTGVLGNALVNQLGFSKIIHLSKGIVGWQEDGHQTISYITSK